MHYEAGVLALSVEAAALTLRLEGAALEGAALKAAGVEEVSLTATLFLIYSLIYALFFKLSLAFV